MELNKKYIDENLNIKLDIIVLDEVDSTNTYAKDKDIKNNTLVITTNQNSGRGRFNRKFYSHKDSGVFFSLKLNNLNLDAILNTLIMGVAVSNNLLYSEIKWLNDIYINNLKVCGILSEGVINNNKLESMIIGVGINLRVKNIPSELSDVMISYDSVVSDFDVNDIVVDIINEFFYLLTIDADEIIDMYKAKCLTLNKDVLHDGNAYKAVDISSEGHLVCLDTQNNKHVFSSGEVSIKI